ncbi:hypothetical protein [Pseudomonas gingeri]
MKALKLILKIVLFPVWLPFWVLKKFWKLLLIALVIGSASGCVTNTGKIDKSPCACTFTPFVTPADKENSNV